MPFPSLPKFQAFSRGVYAYQIPKQTVSAQNVMLRNPLKLNGSLLFVTVFGGARRKGFPVTH